MDLIVKLLTTGIHSAASSSNLPRTYDRAAGQEGDKKRREREVEDDSDNSSRGKPKKKKAKIKKAISKLEAQGVLWSLKEQNNSIV